MPSQRKRRAGQQRERRRGSASTAPTEGSPAATPGNASDHAPSLANPDSPSVQWANSFVAVCSSASGENPVGAMSPAGEPKVRTLRSIHAPTGASATAAKIAACAIPRAEGRTPRLSASSSIGTAAATSATPR